MYLTTASPRTTACAGDTGNLLSPLLTRRSGALLLALAAVTVPCAALADTVNPAPKAARAAPRAKGAASKVTVTKAVADADKGGSASANPVASAGASAGNWEIVVADRTLNAAMARWAAAAGWQLLWELPVDYAVQAHTTVPGKFEDAVAVVVNSMEGAEIPMKAVFYSGNKVLRIMAKGAQ